MSKVKSNKRAHHNVNERNRRENLSGCYDNLKSVLPPFPKATRKRILQAGDAYIQFMNVKNAAHQQVIDELESQLKALDDQIALLQKGQPPKNMASAAVIAENARITLEDIDNFPMPEFRYEFEPEDSDPDLNVGKRKMKRKQRKHLK